MVTWVGVGGMGVGEVNCVNSAFMLHYLLPSDKSGGHNSETYHTLPIRHNKYDLGKYLTNIFLGSYITCG